MVLRAAQSVRACQWRVSEAPRRQPACDVDARTIQFEELSWGARSRNPSRRVALGRSTDSRAPSCPSGSHVGSAGRLTLKRSVGRKA
jgi:hypothetical protein